MNKSFTNWLFKAWPFIVLLIISICHYLVALNVSPDSIKIINKFSSAISQVMGGCIVVYNINSNLGLFNETDLKGLFVGWLKSCPLFKKPKKITATGHFDMPTPIIAGKARSEKEYKYIEEKIEELFRQTDSLHKKISDVDKGAHERDLQLEQKLNTPIQENKALIENLTNKVNSFSVEGLNVQIFGVLLVIYGAILNLL